jgi:hypothetical protein
MTTAPLAHWIVDAAAVLAGPRGAVTRRAKDAGRSRQSIYDHAHKVRSAVEAEQAGPGRDRLIDENRLLRDENSHLWAWLEHTIDFPPERRDEFAVTAAAMGLSLNQIAALLAILLGRHAAPSRSALHRTVQAAGRAAGRVLRVLDERCRALVLVGCLDEIFFHRRPVLVAIEPASMTWFLGRKSGDCQGATWADALRPWSSLEFAVADAGSGVQAGIAQTQRERRDGVGLPLEGGLDVFHTALEARRVLARLWARLERGWENYEVVTRKAEADRRAGRDDRRWESCAEGLWAKVIEDFDAYEAAESGWFRARAALRVTRPDGQLNDRAWATRQVELALPKLPGPEWSKVRGLLESPGTLAFLDRLHRQLSEAEPRDDLRRELIRLWCLSRKRTGAQDSNSTGGSAHVAHLVQALVCWKLEAAWREPYHRVRRVLRGAVRASSSVECMNSVLRMQQSRHRTVTQEMLDLKRLYWNSRAPREGKRRGRCPYQHLGLELPSYSFWDLLHLPVSEVA